MTKIDVICYAQKFNKNVTILYIDINRRRSQLEVDEPWNWRLTIPGHRISHRTS
ncbi:MAG: hypothetical protein SWX82_18625 [Cyanobacteriota bacterium]|nr:hypothetical protein [Cyanobacteriota bacterium]